MANYATLKAAIQQVIKTNGNEEITGSLLQQSLLAMIDSLGSGYQFVGLAMPYTNPGTPDQNVFYIASEPGVYSNFGAVSVSDNEIAILKYNGSWQKDTTGAASVYQVRNMQRAISETMNETPSINIYDSLRGLKTGYINSSGGISVLNGYKYSYPTAVIPGHYYYLAGRNLTIDYGIRCVDADGNPLKVLCAETGQPYSGNWELPNTAGTARVRNGQFLVPTNAVAVEFTVTWNNVGDDSQVMLIDLGTEYVENPVIPSYVPYGSTYTLKGLDEINERIDDLDEEINGEQVQGVSELAYNAIGKYINGANQNGAIYSYSALSLAYFPVRAGITYHIDVQKTTNSAGWELGFATVADGATAVRVLSEYGKGTWNSATYDYIADTDGYIAVGYATDTQIPTVSYVETVGGIVKRIEALEEERESIVYPAIKTPVMFFGDSLTSASSVGVVGFAKLIANWLGLPYRSFVYDSNDGNTNDVPVDYVSYTNYAKDGTRNRVVVDRPKPDSVVERVKRHITADANVSIILIECCVNDMADAGAKGQISDSYTATFDVETTLGAIEETIRYITTLGRPFKLGFFIPWKITWGNPSFFDDHILVFKKWGVPYLDLRETAGFDMRDCAAHRIYSLSSEDYPNYSATTTYNTDDIVKYGGMMYKCKYDNVVGIVPTNSDYWIEMPGGSHDGTHLNSMGHDVVCGKIRNFLESL